MQENPFFRNNATLSGLMMMQGVDPATAIVSAEKAIRGQREGQRQAQMQQRMAGVEKALPEMLNSIDVNDPVASLGVLIAKGVPMQTAQQIIGIAQKQAEMQQPKLKHKFNPVTGEAVLIDERTGLPTGQLNASGGMIEPQQQAGIDIPAQYNNNPAARQKYLESYAASQAKMAAERPLIEEKKKGARDAKKRAGGTVIQDINRAINIVQKNPELTTGFGGLIDFVPETDAKEVEGYIQSALSNVGLDTLQEMRENSPTGGALGQVPIQQQKRLEQVLGSLDKTQSADVVLDNLRRVNNIYMDIIYGKPEEIEKLVSDGKLSKQEAAQYKQRYTLSFDEFGRPLDAGNLSSYSLEELEAMLEGAE